MTLSDLSKLTPEEKRVRIAEAMGFEVLTVATPFKSGRPMGRKRLELNEGSTDWVLLPDYLSDLNAIAEAEKTLRPDQWNAYVNHLDSLNEAEDQPERDFQWVTATASQRADAFLLTI